MSDPFGIVHDDHQDDGRSFAERLVKVQPRLVPIVLAWLAPVLLLVIGGVAAYMTVLRGIGADQSGLAVWSTAWIVTATAPWVAVCLLPVVQRRHLTVPGPFFMYCRWVSILIAVAFPVLWVALWVLGPGDPMGRSAVIFATVGLFTTASALYPWAARLNHAAWLRAQQPA